MAARSGAGLFTGAQDRPVQHPVAVNAVWTCILCSLSDFAPEAAGVMELPWHYYWFLLFAGAFWVASPGFRQPSSVGEEAAVWLGRCIHL